MSTKKGNPHFVEVNGRYYHRDLLFPVKDTSAAVDEDLGEEFVEHDFLAEHGMYAMSPLQELTGEPECFALDAYVQNESIWDERLEGILDDVDFSGDPLEAMIAAEEEPIESYVPSNFLRDEVWEPADDDADVLLFLKEECKKHPEKCDHKRLHMKRAYGPGGERISKYTLVESHGVHGRKRRRAKRVTIRGAIVESKLTPEFFGVTAIVPRVIR